jgi:integrase
MRALGLTADGEMRPDGIGAVAVFGRRRLAEIEPREIKAWLHRLAEAGASPSTVRSYFAPLRALFATAVEEGLIRSNPAAGLRLPASAAASPDGEERAKALTEQELARLLAATPAEWRLIVRLLAFTGLRLGEALALRWSDIDLGRRRLHVRRRVYAGKFAPPKSRYGRRQVPLSESLARELWARRKALRGGEEALVFPGRDGEPLDASTVFRVVKSAARAAGVPWAGPHVLRHTCATMLFRRGLNAKQVQLWLGHHSPAFTLATYVHLLPDDLPDVPEPSWAITAAEEAEPAERAAAESLAAGGRP